MSVTGGSSDGKADGSRESAKWPRRRPGRCRRSRPALFAALSSLLVDSGSVVSAQQNSASDDATTCDPTRDGGEVNFNFNGDNPVPCSGRKCRRMKAQASRKCEHNGGYDMTFLLGGGADDGRRVEVTSCRFDEVLNITSSSSGGTAAGRPIAKLTDAERSFLRKISLDLSAQKVDEMNDPGRISTQTSRAASLLSEWPPGLNIEYALDAGGQRADQESRDFVAFLAEPPARMLLDDGGDDSEELLSIGRERNVRSRRRLREHVIQDMGLAMPSPPYTSLCHRLGRYLSSSDGTVHAEVGLRPPCDDATEGMELFLDDAMNTSSRWECASPPPFVGADLARGNCFGRCGGSCRGPGEVAAQFTLDCADVDFCSRFGVGSSFDYNDTVDLEGTSGGNNSFDVNSANGNCHRAFLDAVDDWMWAGNCDPETGEELGTRVDGCHSHDGDGNGDDDDPLGGRAIDDILDDLMGGGILVGAAGEERGREPTPGADVATTASPPTAEDGQDLDLLPLPSHPAPLISSGNILARQSFEGPDVPTYWPCAYRNAYVHSPFFVLSGNRSAEVTDGAAYQVLSLRRYPTAGSIVKIGGWSRSVNITRGLGGNYSLYADVSYEDGTFVYGKFVPFPGGTSDGWVRGDLNFTLEKNATSLTVYCMYRYDSNSSGGVAWFDDIEVEVLYSASSGGAQPPLATPSASQSDAAGPAFAGAGANLLRSPGFEGDEASVLLQHWTDTYLDGYNVSSSQARSGSSLVIVTNGAALQTVNLTAVPAGSTLRLSGWSKALGTSLRLFGDYSLYMDIFFKNGTTLWGRTAQVPCGWNEWMYVETDVTLDADEGRPDYANVYCMYRDDPGGVGKVWFDDVSLQVL